MKTKHFYITTEVQCKKLLVLAKGYTGHVVQNREEILATLHISRHATVPETTESWTISACPKYN